MTPGEASRVCDAYGERRRDAAYFAFTNAMATGLFIGSIFSSKPAPAIQDVYPELFHEEDHEEAETEMRMERSAANFIKFANSFNRRFDNGNRKSESENNG